MSYNMHINMGDGTFIHKEFPNCDKAIRKIKFLQISLHKQMDELLTAKALLGDPSFKERVINTIAERGKVATIVLVRKENNMSVPTVRSLVEQIEEEYHKNEREL